MATKKKAQEKTDIHANAMLVNLTIHFWRGRKHDRVVTERTNENHNAEHDAGRYHKSLFGGKIAEMRAMTTARSRLRDIHNAHTLPWSDEGWRILPVQNYFEYTAAIRAAVEGFNEAVAKFTDAYPRLQIEAAARLGDMYNPEDYPEPYELARKYGVDVEYSPLPSGADFRVALPQDELDRAATLLESRVEKAVALAMEDAWGRLLDTVEKLRDRLTENEGKGLREAVIRNLSDVADVLTRINLTNDPKLEAARARVEKELAVLDPHELRHDKAVREDAAKKADDILNSIQEAFGGAVAKIAV